MKCDYPYTGDNCTQTYVDYLKENNKYNNYLAIQIFYIMGASITLLLSLCLFYMSFNKKELYLQKITYGSCIYVSLTFIVRGIDPESYSDIIPKIVNQLCWDSSTALLYTVLYVYLFYMIRSLDVYNKNLPVIKKVITIMIFQILLLCIILAFLQTYIPNIESVLRAMKLISCSIILFILCIFINRYNFKILKVIGNSLNINSNNKIIYRKIIFVTLLLNILSLFTIIYQVYYGIILLKIKKTSNLPVNGFSFPIFGLIQYLVVVCLLLTYKKKYIRSLFNNHCNYFSFKNESDIESANTEDSDIKSQISSD
jgi:hypothetical protein